MICDIIKAFTYNNWDKLFSLVVKHWIGLCQSCCKISHLCMCTRRTIYGALISRQFYARRCSRMAVTLQSCLPYGTYTARFMSRLNICSKKDCINCCDKLIHRRTRKTPPAPLLLAIAKLCQVIAPRSFYRLARFLTYANYDFAVCHESSW